MISWIIIIKLCLLINFAAKSHLLAFNYSMGIIAYHSMNASLTMYLFEWLLDMFEPVDLVSWTTNMKLSVQPYEKSGRGGDFWQYCQKINVMSTLQSIHAYSNKCRIWEEEKMKWQKLVPWSLNTKVFYCTADMKGNLELSSKMKKDPIQIYGNFRDGLWQYFQPWKIERLHVLMVHSRRTTRTQIIATSYYKLWWLLYSYSVERKKNATIYVKFMTLIKTDHLSTPFVGRKSPSRPYTYICRAQDAWVPLFNEHISSTTINIAYLIIIYLCRTYSCFQCFIDRQ